MNRRPSSLPPELAAFITPRRVSRRLPWPMRERVLARARAPVARDGAPPPVPHHQGDLAAAVRVRPLVRVAVAASVLLAAGTVWGIVELRRAPVAVVPVATSQPPHVSLGDVAAGTPAASVAPAPPPVQRVLPRPTRSAPRDPFAVELALLQRAQTAYTRRDTSVALAVLAEHAHRFPRGRLAEEREALRVRTLLAAGRSAEAHHVATAFGRAFPRSALLQRLENEERAPP